MFVKVGGPNGSGKTLLTTELESMGKSLGLPIERVKGGDILLQLCNVQTYDELRRIPEEIRESKRPEMYRIMYEQDRMDPATIRIRDAHFSLFEPVSYKFTEAGAQEGDKQQMLMLVVLTPDPELLLARRIRAGEERPDRSLDPATINLEIAHELMYARREAGELGVRLLELPNPEGLIKETTLEVIQAIQESRTGKEGGYFRSAER